MTGPETHQPFPGAAPSTPGHQGEDSVSWLGRRNLKVILGVVGVLAIGAYLVGYLLAGDRLPRNAQISGVSVGRLDRSEAIARLESELTERAAQPITVAIGGMKDRVVPSDAGLAVDVSESVDQAGARRNFDPRHIWRVLTGGSSMEAVVTADMARLNSAVAELADRHDVPPRDATLRYEDVRSPQPRATATPARAGTAVRRAEAAEMLKRAYLRENVTLQLPVDRSPAAVNDLVAQQVRRDFAVPAVSGPIVVKVGKAGQFLVMPSMIARSVTFKPEAGALVADLDANKLRDVVEKRVSELDLGEPRDATVRVDDGRPEVVPAVDGSIVSAAALADAVRPALTKSGADRSVSVEPVRARASFSTEQAETLGVKTVTGEFTTRFPYAAYRNTNIGRAAQLINGTLLKPGETFSLNKVVGERTRAHGVTEGTIISGGKFRLELGGGVSQSATTTYNAMFFAGLEDVEHQPHTLYIDRYPAGREATVAWPSLDLKFRNNTKFGVLVQAERVRARPGTEGSITVKMWSTKTYDRIESSPLRRSNFTSGRDLTDASAKCQPMSPVQGFDVNYSRLFYRDNKIVRTEKFFWRYHPTDRVRCA